VAISAAVTVRYGEKTGRATFSNNEAFFKRIPASFKSRKIDVDCFGEGFIPIDTSFIQTNNTFEL
jgi:hypothetical protein